MKRRFLSAMTVLLSAAGLGWAQPPQTGIAPATPVVPNPALQLPNTLALPDLHVDVTPSVAPATPKTAAASVNQNAPADTKTQAPASGANQPKPDPKKPVVTDPKQPDPRKPGPEGAQKPATKDGQKPATKDGQQPATQQPAMQQPAAPMNGAANGAAAAQPTKPQKPVVDLKDYHSGPDECFWISGDYLLYWTKSAPLPVAIITTSPPGSRGIPGAVGTVPVVANTDFTYGALSGGRLEGGVWINDVHTVGLESGMFGLQQGSTSFLVTSDATGAPVLARPFFNVVTNLQSAALVTSPGAFRGGIAVTSQSELWGADTNLVRNLASQECYQLDLIAGMRFLDLSENLQITASSVALPGGALLLNNVPVTNLTVVDRFGTVNHFYGGQIGGRARFHRGPWIVETLFKLALGSMHEAVNVLGSSTGSLANGAVNSISGGLLAVSGGNYGTPTIGATTSYFAVIPEVRFQLGCQITDHLRAQFGYDFLYLSGVARPGNQIDPAVNPRFVPSSTGFGSSTGPQAPTLVIRQTDFWAQGINVGLALSF